MNTFNQLLGFNNYNSWNKVPRAPAAVGALIFGSSGFFATTTILGVSLATIGGFLVTTAITSWLVSALAPKPGSSSGQQGILSNRREAIGAFEIVYGKVRKGGTITYMETNGTDNKQLHYIIVVAGHEVDAIEDIYINDEIVSLNSNGFVTGDRWKEKIRVRKFLGTENQTAPSELVTFSQQAAQATGTTQKVTSAFRGRGIAYLYVMLDYDQEVFADGIPTVTCVVKGKKVYDPRTQTTAWSDNSALCIRDYLASNLGLNSNQEPSSLSSTDWVTAANVCDTTVAKKGGGSEKRYTVNGVLSTDSTPRANIQKLLTTCAGTLFWGNGTWRFKAGYLPSGPYIEFTEDDFRSSISMVTKNSRKDNFNAVAGVFVDASKDWIATDYPRYSSPVFLALDNNQENVLDFELPMTTSSATAQRLAKLSLFRSREEIIISAEFGLKALDTQVGDVVELTFSRYGFNKKLFEVISWRVVPSSEDIKIELILKETSAAAYDWDAEEKDILSNNTRLPNPTDGLSITGLTGTNVSSLQSDGTYFGRVQLNWNSALSSFVDKYVVEWKLSSSTVWSATETPDNSIVIGGIAGGATYNFRVRARSIGGFIGLAETITFTLGGKDTPPGLPTNVTTKNLYKAVEVSWANPLDNDLNHIEVYSNSTNSLSGSTLAGKVNGTNFIYNLAGGETRWFFVRSVDNTGNKSNFTNGVSGTGLFIESSDVDIDVPQLLEDAGLSAVEILDNLPASGNTVGRTVYLTTDQQLYIWDGTQWKLSSSADIGNLVLQDSNFPNDLRPIEIVTSLPTAGNFEGRVVYLTTDGVIYRYSSGSFTSAVKATDVTGQITRTQISDNAISTGQLDTNAVTTDKLAANSVVAGKIAAAAIAADNIQAGAIVASKIAITDTSNMVAEGDFSEGGVNWTTEGSGTSAVFDISYSAISKFMLRIIPSTSGTGFTSALSKNIAVTPGRSYHLGANIYSNGAHSSSFRINWFRADGTSLSYSEISSNQNYNWEYVNGNATAPAQAVFAVVELNISNASAPGAYIQMANVTMRQAASSELIVDGAITTDKLAANSVTAGIIAAGAVNAAAISSGAVTADKINVNNLAAISANLGTITGGSLNINNNFIVNASGQATIRSGTSGERLVITNNRIDVYDANNVLRVRIGQL